MRRLLVILTVLALCGAGLMVGLSSVSASVTTSFRASDDGYVMDTQPSQVTGDANLTAAANYDGPNGPYHYISYFKFTVTGVTTSVTGVHLQLHRSCPGAPCDVTTGTVSQVTDNTWSETTLNWNNKPAIGTTIFNGDLGQTPNVDVSSFVTGNGTYSFAVQASNAYVQMYYTDEDSSSANRPNVEVIAADPTTTTTAAPTTTTTTTPPSGHNYPARGSVGATGTLTTYTGNSSGLQVRGAGNAGCVYVAATDTCTISNAKIIGGMDIYTNAVLNNVYIEQDGRWWGNIVIRNGKSLTIDGCTIKPTNTSPNDGRYQDGVHPVLDSPITVKHCDISLVGKGGWLGNNTVWEDNWIHDLTPYFNGTQWTHKGCLMSDGGANWRVTRMRCEPNNPDPYNATTNPGGYDGATQTGSILLQPGTAITNGLIDDSCLMGGGYALRMQGGNLVTGLRVRNVVFGPSQFGMYTYSTGVGIAEWSAVTGDRNCVATTTVVPRPPGS